MSLSLQSPKKDGGTMMEYHKQAIHDSVRGLYPSSGKGVWGEGVFNQSTLSNFDARKNARYARFMRVKVQPYKMTTSLSSYSSSS